MYLKKQLSTKELGQKIKKIRGNLSPTEFAKRVGIKPSLIASYERGERLPSLASLERLANYEGVSIEELLGLDEAPLYKLTPGEERVLSQLRKLRKSSPQAKLPDDILLYLLLIIGLFLYLKYLGMW